MRSIVTCLFFAVVSGWCVLFTKSTPNHGILFAPTTDSVPFRATPSGRFEGTVTLLNAGPGGAEINAVTPACGCTRIASFPKYLPAGSSGEVFFEIEAKATSGSNISFDEVAGITALNATFKVEGDFGVAENRGLLLITCSGTFEMPVTVEAGATNFGTLSTAGPAADFVIPLLNRRSIRSISVVQAPYGIESKIHGENLRLSIDPGNSALSGRGFRLGSRQVVLRVTEANGAIVFTPLSLRFDLVPPIRFQPSRLVFGPVLTGEPCIRQIRIIPDMVTVHEIRSAELGEFTFSSGKSARFDGSRTVGQGIELDVSMQPETDGIESFELPVIVLGGDGHRFEVNMPVTVISRSNARP